MINRRKVDNIGGRGAALKHGVFRARPVNTAKDRAKRYKPASTYDSVEERRKSKK